MLQSITLSLCNEATRQSGQSLTEVTVVSSVPARQSDAGATAGEPTVPSGVLVMVVADPPRRTSKAQLKGARVVITEHVRFGEKDASLEANSATVLDDVTEVYNIVIFC